MSVRDAAARGVEANERLTALMGLVLLVLMVAAILTVPDPRDLATTHIVLGVLLSGPLLLKLASTGYRFASYYLRRAAYVARGPPPLFLRVLAPLLVASTIALVASGFALLLSGPGRTGPWLGIHGVSFLVWLPAFVLHSIAHARSSVRQSQKEIVARRAPGRGSRLAVDFAALALGLVGAVLIFAPARGYSAGLTPEGQGIPGALIAGVLLALVVTGAVWRTRAFQTSRGNG